jgi:hypothetical protein
MTEAIHVSSPKLQAVNEAHYAPNIITSGISSSRENIKVTTSHSEISSAVNFNVPGSDLLDACMLFNTTVKIAWTIGTAADLSGATGGIPHINGLYTGSYENVTLRRYPLNSCMNTLDVMVNNTSLTVRPYQLLPLSEYEMNRSQDNYLSTPTQRDIFANYDYSIVAANRDNAENPYAKYANAKHDSRTRFPRKIEYTGTLAAVTGISVEFDLTEPFLFHPFCSSSHENRILGRASNVNININWNNLLSMFAHITVTFTINANDFITQKVTFSSSANLLYQTYTANTPIEWSINNPYMHRSIINTSIKGLAANETQLVNIDQQTFSTVPERIYVFGIPSDTRLSNQCECMLSIEQISFRVGLDSNALGTASKQSLFQMAKRNGYVGSWTEYNETLGGALCIDLNHGDIAGYIPNSAVPFTFSAQVKVRNISMKNYITKTLDDVVDYNVFLVAETAGKLILSEGSSTSIVGMSAVDAGEALASGKHDYYSHDVYDHSAGSWKGFGKFMKKISKGIIHIAPQATRMASNMLKNNPETSAIGSQLGHVASALGGSHGGSLVVAGNYPVLNQTQNVSKIRRVPKKRF